MLLIGGSDRIVITHLNGTGLQPLRSLSVNGTLALDFQHNQESVCWVLSTESSGQLRCAETRNLRGFTREREIRTQQSLQRTFSSCSWFPLFLTVHSPFSLLSFHDNSEWLCALKSWTLSPTPTAVHLSRWDTRRSLTHACSCSPFLLSLTLLPVSSVSIPLHYPCGWMQVSLGRFSCSPFPYSCPSNMLATLASLLQKGALPLLFIWSEFSIYQTCLMLTMHDFQPLFFSFEVWSHSLHHCSYNQQVNARAFIQDPCIRGVGLYCHLQKQNANLPSQL